MRFSILNEHLDFFHKHRSIAFQDLISSEERESLSKEIERRLQKLSGKLPLSERSNKDLWQLGRGLSKEIPGIAQWISRSHLGKIAAELFKKNLIRLAYDQVLMTRQAEDLPYQEPFSLADISSIDPILGGALLCIEFPSSETELPDLTHQIPGYVTFLDASYPIPFPELFKMKNICCLLICFTQQKARYKLETKDYHTHLLKKEGYAFGDLLLNTTHPLLHY